MVPPDPERPTSPGRLPTLSWESVVDRDDSSVDVDEPAESRSVASLEPPVESAPAPQIASAPSIAPNPIAPLVAPSAVLEPVSLEPMQLDAPAIRTAPPSPVIPAIGEVEIGPADVSPASTELPEIREATPVVESPRLPSVAQPDQSALPVANVLADAPAVAPKRKPARRRRSRRGLKLVVMLVLLAGMVAAGIVFGRPYLFPSEWSGTSAPYAEAVEAGGAVAFVEPITLTTESETELATRQAAQLIAPFEGSDGAWRALGLMTGSLDPAGIAAQVTGTPAAIYSLVDGQVYRSTEATTADGAVTQAFAAAALDQDLAWSTRQDARTLDDRAATSAEVLRRARAVQESSEFGDPVAPVTTAQIAGLPAVLQYQLAGPHAVAEFALPQGGGEGDGEGADADPLRGLGDAGPGPFLAERPVAASQAQMVGSDTPVRGAAPMDRSFWYLSFAGFLDPATAYLASDAIVENSLLVAERPTAVGPMECVYATFSGGGIDQTDVLRSALEQWSAAAPLELSTSFSVLDDGALQLVSCDPGAAFETPIRPDAARELVSWRVAELATLEAVRSGGSTDVAADFAFAWPIVVYSNLANDLISMPADVSPQQFAEAARSGVTAIFTPAG